MSKYKTALMPLVILQQYQNLFWSKINRSNNCWYWLLAPASNKYGLFTVVHNKIRYRMRAHRAAWMLQHNCEIQHKLLICHHCDNPICVNPDHLFLGTDADNLSDMARKGRSLKGRTRILENCARGENNGLSKLTTIKVQKIKTILSTPDRPSYRQIAKQFGVGYTTIRNIAKGDTWRHV